MLALTPAGFVPAGEPRGSAALSCVAIASGQVCPTTRYARMRDGHLELLFFDDLSGDNFSFEIGSGHDRLPATPAISPC